VAPVDLLALCLIGIAVLRGFFLGLIREAFSLAAIAAAWVAVRWFGDPAGDWLQAATDGRVGELMAPWIAGAGVAIATVLAVALIGRVVRTGARAVGLGLLDRAGGALLGAAEGSLVIAVLLVLGTTLLGRDHPVFQDTRTLAAFERAEAVASGARDTDVAAPPPRGTKAL
jgi:membrane protein required for colicin V production